MYNVSVYTVNVSHTQTHLYCHWHQRPADNIFSCNVSTALAISCQCHQYHSRYINMDLAFERLAVKCTNAHRTTPLKNHFIYLDNKEFSTLLTLALYSVLFSTKFHLFHNFILLIFSINHALKFIYTLQ